MEIHTHVVQPPSVRAAIGFRVECHDATNVRYFNGSMGPEGMIPRGTDLTTSWESLDAHLSWTREPTPFLSFFRSWDRAMIWRQHLIERGGTNIIILAVWLEGKPRIYDAHAIARMLDYEVGSADPRRRLEHHEEEILLHGAIFSNEYRILACFKGDNLEIRHFMLRFPVNPAVTHFARFSADALLPPTSDPLEWLKDEMVSLTGVMDHVKLCVLLHAVAGIPSRLLRLGDWDVVQTSLRAYAFPH
ncbi:hypothetical protein HIM_11312 [Hirsutella minnesotensis 3608]|uniref:DUF7587 domain-containing protein n=1 Tax=Hirsutella minnesotensis 3608 TaxID=1043627 RepID=A0A0F8A1D0_9HYPO|nr:hypothetical protein HIM_11312 [Hirsutella minnesotensis 3608]